MVEGSETKTYTLEQVSEHVDQNSCWLVIHGKVYDVTEFLEEHPGGYDIILSSTGKDATQEFDDVGHSNHAREMLKQYLIGDFAGGDSRPIKEAPAIKAVSKTASPSAATRIFQTLLPLLLIVVAVLVNLYFSSNK